MDDSKVFMFPEGGTKSSIDSGLLTLLSQNGGFGGGNGIWWILFLFMMWNQNGRNGNFSDFAAQYSGSEGRQYLAEIMNGRFDNLGNLATIMNSGIETVKNGIFALQTNISQVGASVGLTAAQTQNAILLGNANLSQLLCECCCNMRYDLSQQTNSLQSQAAANAAAEQLQLAQHDANVRLQLAQNEAADQLSVCQLTNQLGSLADRNTNSIINAIGQQSIMINEKFCDLEKRELQNRITAQGDMITQLRNQISNDNQTLQFNAAFRAIDDKIDAIAAKQPNTVPVQYPNLVAVNQTPYGGGFGWGNNWGWNNGWNGSFWG